MNTVATPIKHSGLGIASTVIAVLAGLVMLGAIFYAGYVGMNEPGGQLSETDPRAITIGVLMLGSMAVLLLGAILGIAGLFVGERKRVFSWIGLVLNALPILGGLALILLGLAMS
ncbi:hypothetical protein [Arenimonas caeni]|uniref:DUF4064 domain-containing protein n=1 Tax=Arenimonas caeni TaxID=2058085 RepID=A0A2P6MCJ9_9GAMM|nr:hypothetical protein [Arenimonas caeni]PRH83696.1 hypothetical protein C6N40_00700 [Arenimonas caeni]